VLKTFDYANVRLLPGRHRDQVEHARAFYGAYPDDNILKGFRRNAGLPAPGEDMGGWCTDTCSEIFGQLLGGLAKLGRATGDVALIEKSRRLFAGWLATLPPDGNPRLRLYDWEKLAGGLVDLHLYADEPDAMPALERLTRWAERTFDRTRMPADGHDFWGAGGNGTSEWYTLPENLYRAFQATGKTLFRDFADLWRYESFWAPFADGIPATVQPDHAYSHVNSFSSAAMAHAVTGERRYLDICRHAYDFMQTTQCYATGGYGPDERLMPPDGSLGRALDVMAYHAEEPCGAWAGFKLARYLIGFTGEARFGDWIETLLINTIGAALPPQPDGRVYYYGNYAMAGGTKQFYWQEWPCCSGTYLQDMAEYHNLVYFHAPGALHVNLYVPSEVTWQHDGQTVRLTQETGYPEVETTTMRLSLPSPSRFTLKARVPGWAAGMQWRVNGTPMDVIAAPGQWATLDREWHGGDVVELRIPMPLRLQPVDPQHPARAAIMCGPVVLAQDEACCRRPFCFHAGTKLETRLKREPAGLRFRILNTTPERHTRYLQPLYDFPQNWPYFVYFDLHKQPLY
jgi:DUF1680 family protein